MERQVQPKGCIIEVMSRHHSVQSREMTRDDEILTCTGWRGVFTDPTLRLIFHLQSEAKWGSR